MTENGVRLMDRNYIPSQNPLRIQLERVRERKEKREQEIKEFAERLAREEQARIAAYNEPLPEFSSKIPADVRQKLLSYLRVVLQDAVWVDGSTQSLWPQKVSVALRISLVPSDRKWTLRSTFFIRALPDEPCLYSRRFWGRVENRLARNFLKNISFFESLERNGYITFAWWESDLTELKKKGFRYQGEAEVRHFEIIE